MKVKKLINKLLFKKNTMSEEQREPIPVEALPFTGVYSECQHRIGTGNIVKTLNGYCWECSMATKEFQQIVISCLPIALHIIGQVIYTATVLRGSCLAYAANERKE